jgi:hypothetical protein
MEWFMLTDSIPTSATIWFVIGVTALYLSRASAHQAIIALARLVHGGLRLAARALEQSKRQFAARNREVLLGQGREAKERLITREFERITATVNRDLSRYPETQRLLSETIQRIDDDHQSSTAVPPEVPGWGKAVQTVAEVADNSDPAVRDILGAIHKALAKAHDRTLGAYRNASRERHQLLSRMRPGWQTIQRTLTQMDRAVNSILERARSIDRHMDEYRDIVSGSDRATHALSTSALVQFSIAALVLAIAIGGSIINFSLIARPMAEMVGGTSYVGPFQTADIAALVIILVEISMGLFLMESLRITRLFPVIAALPDRSRTVMAWIAFIILASLASVEAGLAYMREVLLQDELATAALLRDAGANSVMTGSALWITTAAQMGMGFILPFALTFVAIPLETFVMTLRHVLGLAAQGLLSALAFCLRLTGHVVRQTSIVVLHVYDIVIFAPLGFERWLSRRKAMKLELANRSDGNRSSTKVAGSGSSRQSKAEHDRTEPASGYGYGGNPA